MFMAVSFSSLPFTKAGKLIKSHVSSCNFDLMQEKCPCFNSGIMYFMVVVVVVGGGADKQPREQFKL